MVVPVWTALSRLYAPKLLIITGVMGGAAIFPLANWNDLALPRRMLIGIAALSRSGVWSGERLNSTAPSPPICPRDHKLSLI
ncbi:hypothetical protein QBC38DRAFT_104313 [Podospora fimiseda]|uniref:Uncharacterized protein n=1 Tax=Podospora fimiseda TaxID=252190 RepID=A0AAN7BTS3_9PEZI|nr:hypothetical protein QBC38DRAFT_104313 [Podospora fimiseda]